MNDFYSFSMHIYKVFLEQSWITGDEKEVILVEAENSIMAIEEVRKIYKRWDVVNICLVE